MLANKHLINELQNNNQEAFDKIYKKYYKLVAYVIYSRIRDREITKELVQDSFLKMWNNIHMYRHNTNFRAWLLTIAKNVALDYLRTRKIYYQLNQDEVSDSRFTSMLNEFDTDAKRVLTDFEYDVVVLSIVYNLKRREVAKVLDRPLGTITRVYSEAMKKLKEFYENYTWSVIEISHFLFWLNKNSLYFVIYSEGNIEFIFLE